MVAHDFFVLLAALAEETGSAGGPFVGVLSTGFAFPILSDRNAWALLAYSSDMLTYDFFVSAAMAEEGCSASASNLRVE